ncbi:asparagine synthase-related protein [Cupriavidus sp. PET2-C1]
MADLHAVSDMTRDRARRGPGAEGLVGLGARAFDHRRTVADVPMSVLLSGGMDTSPITGLLAETGTPDLRAYAIGLEAVGGEAAVTVARALRIPVVALDFLVPAHDHRRT